MKNKFTLLWVLCAAIFQSVQAQQEPLFAQYNTNAYLINPAVAGSMGGHSIRAFHRWQWVSFPGAPKTFGVTYQGLVKNQHGVGGLIFADQTGPLTRVGGKASYAFHIPLADNKYRLSMGLAGRYVFNRIRTNAITFIQQNDQAVADLSRGVHAFDAEFGVFFHSPKFYVGVAAPNLLQAKLDYGQNAGLRNPVGYGYVHYFATAGYRFHVGDASPKLDSAGKKIGTSKAVHFEPSIMVKYVRGAQVQVDGGLMAFFLEKQLGFGLFYRSPGFISAQARFLFDNHIPVVLAFDVATSRFQQYSAGATEVMAGYDFAPQNGGMFAPPPPKTE